MLNDWTQCFKLGLFWEDDSGDQKVSKLVISSSGHFLLHFLDVNLVVITILILSATLK